MKFAKTAAQIVFIFLLFQCSSENREASQFVNFGLKPPGLTPTVFAPVYFQVDEHRLHSFPTFSKDGKEIYWSVVPQKVLFSAYQNGAWSALAEASFSTGNMQSPFISPSDQKMYFQYSPKRGMRGLDICFVEKKNGAWGALQHLPSPPNSDQMETQPTLTKDGTLYFGGYSETFAWNRAIFRSRLVNGEYQQPELLPEKINSMNVDYTPFIAPDESFLLFSSTRPTEKEADIRLYVSFRDASDNWSDPVNINEKMNFNQPSRYPGLTPDGKAIVFLSGNTFYWVSSEILEQCR